MSDLVKRLRFNSTAGVPDFTNSKLLEEAADRVDTMETMLQAMADGRIVMLARIEELEEALLIQKENAGRMMTDFVAAANKDAAGAVDRIEALEKALRKIAELEYLTDEAMQKIAEDALAPEQDK